MALVERTAKRVTVLTIRPRHRPEQLLQGAANRWDRDPGHWNAFFSPAGPGPPSLALVPGLRSRRPTSPGRHGGGNHATSGPRNDSGLILASSAGSLAPPASGS